MKQVLTILFAVFISTSVLGQQTESKAAIELIDSLKSISPKFEGVTVNKYFIIDIDNDGIYEVVERTNSIETEHPGWLNVDLASAFEYDIIYRFYKGRYMKSDANCELYLIQRHVHYEHWINLIEK